MTEEPKRAPFVFISYSRGDKDTLEEVRRYLDPLQDEHLAEIWVDQEDIEPGRKWGEEIDAALTSATIAVLLITQRFLTSDFICSEELPRIFEKQAANELVVLPVFVSPCTSYLVTSGPREIDLRATQGFASPERTLNGMEENERQWELVQLYKHLRELVGAPLPASVPPRPRKRLPVAAIITAAGTIAAIVAAFLGWQTMNYNDAVTHFESGSLAGVTELMAHGDKGQRVVVDGLDTSGTDRTFLIIKVLSEHPDVVADYRRDLEAKAEENRKQLDSLATTIEMRLENSEVSEDQLTQLDKLAHVGVCMNALLKTEPRGWPELAERVRVLLRELPACKEISPRRVIPLGRE